MLRKDLGGESGDGSRDMLDLIFSNRVYDLGQIYDPGDFANTLIYMTMTDDRDVASK